jgi:hypothetical protein
MQEKPASRRMKGSMAEHFLHITDFSREEIGVQDLMISKRKLRIA